MFYGSFKFLNLGSSSLKLPSIPQFLTIRMSEVVQIRELYTASPEQVWRAITEREKMKVWYFDIPDFKLEVGAEFNFFEPGFRREFHHRATITEIVPKKKLQYTWTYPSHSIGKSLLTWEIVPENTGTSVLLTHDGVDNFSDGGKDFNRENYLAGWTDILSKSLKQFLDSE